MAKTASKYISFDSDGRLFADETVGVEEPAAAEASENPSLKAAVAYALDAIVDAASALPENAAALIAPAPKAAPVDPEEATLTVGCDVRSTIGDDFAVTATEETFSTCRGAFKSSKLIPPPQVPIHRWSS